MTDPHLDDEQLSLLLDGVDVDGRAHAEDGTCAACADRLAALRSARDAVAGATVPPLPADVLDRIVARALDAPPVAEVVPLRSAPRRRRLTTPPPAWLVGAAAGIAVLVGVAGVLRAVDRPGSGSDDSLAVSADEESAESRTGGATADQTAPVAGTASAAGSSVVAVDPEAVTRDLADQDDPVVLARTLDGLTMQVTPTAGALSAAPYARESAATDGATVDKSAGAGAAAPPATTVVMDRAQCRAQADAIGAGRFGELLSTATLRWKGRPAEVLVFRLAEPSTPDSPATRQGLVLSRPGCELLADPRF